MIGSKIDLLDSADLISKKIKKAECFPKIVEGNGVLALVEFVLLPGSELKTGRREFVVDRSRDGLEPLVYTDFKQVKEDYENDIVSADFPYVCARTDMSHPPVDPSAGQTRCR